MKNIKHRETRNVGNKIKDRGNRGNKEERDVHKKQKGITIRYHHKVPP
jgi:hypothetical protein